VKTGFTSDDEGGIDVVSDFNGNILSGLFFTALF